MHAHLLKAGAVAASVVVAGILASGQTPPPAKPAAAQTKTAAPAKPAAAQAKAAPVAGSPAPAGAPFFIHGKHVKELGFDCETCHVPVSAGSVVLKRPGHDQCMGCHQEAYDNIDQKYCSLCHSDYPPTSSEGLLPYPQFKKQRAILFEFSHAKHVDPKGRINAQTGFRADCTFCHKFEPKGQFATFPGHTECASCHSQPGYKPMLSATSATADCRGCHNPEEIENPGFTTDRRMIAPHVVSGTLVNVKFSHAPHFAVKDQYKLDCTSCHYAVPTSTSLADLTLPRMIDCVECHDTSKSIDAQYRMTNCSTCHVDTRTGAAPASHVRNVKPAFHTDAFRQHHEAEATAPGAKCFVCHQNVTAPLGGGIASNVAPAGGASQCVSCHQVMMPASHTGRWKDDIHGKFAAIDRESCALCHTADTCSRCHNQLPASHAPLSLFKAGIHANLARADERACFTCHTFQNTCSQCHTQGQRR